MQDDPNVRKLRNSTQPGEIAKTVAELRAAAHAALVQSRGYRLEAAKQTRQSLKSHRAMIRGAVEGICLSARRSLDNTGSAVERVDRPSVDDTEDQKWDFYPEGEAASAITKHDLVRVIEQHPEGVSLIEIGNALGTDWRGLVNWSRRLVIDGKVDKFDELFYPARE